MNGRQISRVAVAAATALALALVPAAFAGKGGKPAGGGGAASGSSVRLVLMDGATEPRVGGRITFEVTTTADKPFVGVRCWQGENWVYDAYVGLFAGAMFDPWLTLGSTNWAPGVEASCTARLFYYDNRGRQKVLATTDFLVAA